MRPLLPGNALVLATLCHVASAAEPALLAPPLSGAYAVGRTTWQWTDPAGPHRALVLYPAASTASGPSPRASSRAVADTAATSTAVTSAAVASVAVTRSAVSGTPAGRLSARYGSVAAAQLSRLQVRSATGLDAATGTAPRPVLLFAAGAHQSASDYTVLLEQIASRGYVVVGFDAPVGGGDAYAATAAEFDAGVREIERQRGSGPLKAQLGERIGAFGHSIGGASAVLAAARNPRIAAAFNLDGDFDGAATAARPVRPIAMLVTEAPPARGWLAGWGERRSEQRRSDIWARVRATAPDAVLLSVRGMYHANFLDAALLPPAVIDADKRHRFGSIDGARGLLLTADLVDSFFAAALGRAPATAALRAAAARHPEVSPPPTAQGF